MEQEVSKRFMRSVRSLLDSLNSVLLLLTREFVFFLFSIHTGMWLMYKHLYYNSTAIASVTFHSTCTFGYAVLFTMRFVYSKSCQFISDTAGISIAFYMRT